MANPQPDQFTKISNDILDALCKTRMRGEYRQVFDFILRKTYGFNKKSDEISTNSFIQGTCIKRHAIHKARKWLKDNGFITVTQKGYTSFLSYSIQKDYEKWKVSPKKVTVTQKGYRVSPKKVTKCNPIGLHPYIERKKDNEQKKVPPTPFEIFSEKFIHNWNNVLCVRCPKIAKIRSLSSKRKKWLRDRFKEADFKNCFIDIMKEICESSFLRGDSKDWRVDLDWVIKNDTNYLKILEGTYKDKRGDDGSDAKMV